MNTIDLARAAGILEGEGYFGAKASGYTPRVSCEMTDKDVVVFLHDLFGGTLKEAAARQENWKMTWRWTVSGIRAAEVMRMILPYMFERRGTKIVGILARYTDNKSADAKEEERRQQAALEYLTTTQSLRALGKKYGISHQTISNRAKKLQMAH